MNDRHQIEEVGEKLRGMMPWIKGNALVDKVSPCIGTPPASLPATECPSGASGLLPSRSRQSTCRP
jgi:hypothetical protein